MSHELAPPPMSYDERIMRATEALFLGGEKLMDENGNEYLETSWEHEGAKYVAWTPINEHTVRTETWVVKVQEQAGIITNEVYWRVNYAAERRNWLHLSKREAEMFSVNVLPVHVLAARQWATAQEQDFGDGRHLADSQAHYKFLDAVESYGFSESLKLT